jgi:hypothetical protein
VSVIVEAEMAEWGLSLAEAFGAFPLAAFLCLQPAMLQRHGATADGPDYVDRAAIAARGRAWAFLHKHFEVLPADHPEPPPMNQLARWLAAGAAQPEKD